MSVALTQFDVLRKPVITEKATLLSEQNKVVFHIAPTATKTDVKAAVENLFKVKVEKVNVINIKGKAKRFRGMTGRRNAVRKAVVSLADGQTIDLTAGV